MKDFKYLFDKNIEINLTGNDNSINYKDNTNITSINRNDKNSNNFNMLLPSYNQHHYKDEKSSSLINKFLNKKEEFFEEHNEYNDNKILKINSKYSTCNNYYPRKNYNKFLNSHQQINSSIMNNNNIYQQNTTFEGMGGYSKLNTRDLIEITKKRKEIIEQKKLKEEQKKRIIETNLNNLENLDIVVNKNSNNSPLDEKNYCDEGVQTSLININYQDNETNNKKDEPMSTIIFTDKSALINQEITFLSIQYSLKNTENNIEDSKEYKNTENDFVNLGCDNKESIHKDKDIINNIVNKKINNMSINNKTKKENVNINKITNNKIENEDKNNINKESINNINNKIQKKEDKENDKINNNEDIVINSENKNNEQDIEFTIINNTSNTPPKNEKEEENYMTNGLETFQIESNTIVETKDNNIDNNNIDSNNFTITNNNIPQNKKEENKILKDSLEDSNDNNCKLIDNIIKSQKSLSNSDENELTEIEEFDQNIIFLQNESKTMSSHFEKLNKNKKCQEENNTNNKDNILIEDKDIFSNKSNNLNSSEDNVGNYSKTLDIDKNDFLDSSNSISSKNKNMNDNKNNNVYNTHDDNKCIYKENVFRSKGKKNNSLNKYNDYPTLRNIKENNSVKTKIFNNNNYTNNNRYNNKIQNFEEKDNTECFDLLKLKTSDLKLNNQEEKIIIKPLKKSNDNNNNIKPSTSACNNTKSNFQNIKFSSHKKLNSNINNNNNKNNISGIPIRPYQPKKNNNMNNLEINNNINNVILKNNNIKNYLITPRCFKKKRQLNNYVEYYKLKMSMCKDDYNNFTNNNNNNNNYINTNNENNHYKNFKSLGHKKSTENCNK